MLFTEKNGIAITTKVTQCKGKQARKKERERERQIHLERHWHGKRVKEKRVKGEKPLGHRRNEKTALVHSCEPNANSTAIFFSAFFVVVRKLKGKTTHEKAKLLDNLFNNNEIQVDFLSGTCLSKINKCEYSHSHTHT